jgi:hypothetical protein
VNGPFNRFPPFGNWYWLAAIPLVTPGKMPFTPRNFVLFRMLLKAMSTAAADQGGVEITAGMSSSEYLDIKRHDILNYRVDRCRSGRPETMVRATHVGKRFKMKFSTAINAAC